MRSKILVGLLVFSLSLNFAVLGTAAWRYYAYYRPAAVEFQGLTPVDVRQIQHSLRQNAQEAILAGIEAITEKRAELLDQIAADPSNTAAIQARMAELHVLKGNMEKIAARRIIQTAAELPAEKRKAFVNVLKNRTCMGQRGMGGCGGGCYMGR